MTKMKVAYRILNGDIPTSNDRIEDVLELAKYKGTV